MKVAEWSDFFAELGNLFVRWSAVPPVEGGDGAPPGGPLAPNLETLLDQQLEPVWKELTGLRAAVGELADTAGVDVDLKPVVPPPRPPTGVSAKIGTAAGDAAIWRGKVPPDFEAPTPLHSRLVAEFWSVRERAVAWILNKDRLPIFACREITLDLLAQPGDAQVVVADLLDAGKLAVWNRFGAGQLKRVRFVSGPKGEGDYHDVQVTGNAGFWTGVLRELEGLGLLENLEKWGDKGWVDLRRRGKAEAAGPLRFVSVADTPDPRKKFDFDLDGDILTYRTDFDFDGKPELEGKANVGEIFENAGHSDVWDILKLALTMFGGRIGL